ncbi:MAG: transposase [Patescibacteria group bacterium]
MATRNFKFSLNEYYHCFNRGIEKRNIFTNENDKIRFQKLLYLCNGNKELNFREIPTIDSAYDVDVGKRLIDIGSYAMMDNHHHVLAKERQEGGISKFMMKLGTSHSMYFNLCNNRTGRLFEGTFKAVHIKNNEHLKYLFAYIHLNPGALFGIKPGKLNKHAARKVLQNLRDYKFSSYSDHLDLWRPESKILNLDTFPKYFANIEEYETEMLDWLTYEPTKGNPLFDK